MSWNYRIFKREYPDAAGQTTYYELHEVYYNSAGKIVAWTIDPMSGPADSVDDLMSGLRMMARDAYKYRNDVLDFEMAPEGNWDWDEDEEEE